jgi:RuvA, C-terminal domain
MNINARSKNRPVLGLLLFTAGFFLLLGSSCGLVGELMASVSRYLVGRTGTILLVLMAWTAGIILAVPPGALSRVLARRIGGSKKAPKPTIGKIRKMEASGAGAYSIHSPSFGRQVQGAMRLRDVRSALKNLGYTKEEYEPIVVGMDPEIPTEKLLRSALNMLQVN